MAAIPVTIPELGEIVSRVRVVRWLKAVGDPVEAGEPLVEVSTDKVDVLLESPASGRLATIASEAGARVAIGAVVGTVEGED